MAVAAERGNTLIEVSEAETRTFLDAFQAVEERWVTDATARGLPAADLLAAAKAAVARHARAEAAR